MVSGMENKESLKLEDQSFYYMDALVGTVVFIRFM